ncbi:MAG: UbiA family prenyltransferase, partial [Bacteroidota bacterium]
MNYLKLIRFYNLLIMALTMYAIRWFIIFPVLKSYGYSLQISEILFFLLVISTLTIAGGGYVINDYFDRKADRINDPKNVIVGTKIHRRFAIILHSVLNVVGVGLGFFVSIEIGHWKYGFIFLLTTGILWFYSTTYKRKFLIGNFVISLITAFIPLLVLFFETSMLKTNFSSTDSDYKLFIHYIY